MQRHRLANSSAFSTLSSGKSSPTGRSTSSPIIMPPINIPKCWLGWRAIRALEPSTSPRPLPFNAVENFFSKMTRPCIRRGIFRSIADLQAAINAYLAEHNASPKPFVWTKPAEVILTRLYHPFESLR